MLQLQNTIVDFIITTVMAYLLYLLFEGPCTLIMKIFEGDQLFIKTTLECSDSVERLESNSDTHSSQSNDSEESFKKIIENTLNTNCKNA